MDKKLKQNYYSFIHKLLIKFNRLRFQNSISKWIWNKTWEYSIRNYKGLIHFKLHGQSVLLNNGNPYPLFINTFPKYNYPLIEIVYQTFKESQKQIVYIDIGAATGDTMLLLFQKCPNMISKFYCIDGDNEFHELQKENLKKHLNGVYIKQMLSDKSNRKVNSLIRIHHGTASSQGDTMIESKTLDELFQFDYPINQLDLIKIDVDGLDGMIINGSFNLLNKFKCTLIFEWHPVLYKKTNNNVVEPFEALKSRGYNKFVFYDKYGNFSQYHTDISSEEIEALNELCLKEINDSEPHFDVIAIHNSKNLNINELISLNYSSSLN